jgi:bifunctional non-homologous end joining protein LigD
VTWANSPGMLPKIAPMKAVTGELAPDGDAWAAEVKWDGQRLTAAVGDPAQPLRLDTTRGLDAAERFPELGGLPAALAPHRLVLDGEAVAFGEDDRPSFGRLQHRMHLTRPAEIARVAARIPVRYVVFDLLWLDDRDLTTLPYLKRRDLLAELVEPGEGWLVPAHHVGGGADLLAAARAQQLEGIVVKRVDSRYLPGKRSPVWRKVKVRPRQEFVVVAGTRASAAWPASSEASRSASTKGTSCASQARWAPGSPSRKGHVSDVCWTIWRPTRRHSIRHRRET